MYDHLAAPQPQSQSPIAALEYRKHDLVGGPPFVEPEIPQYQLSTNVSAADTRR